MSSTALPEVDEVDPLVLSFAGELDAGDPDFADRLLAEVGGARYVVVDMIDVSFIDSSIIRALVLARRATEASGGWLRLVYTHHLVRRVIDMCGLSDLLPQYPSIESAMRNTISEPPASERQPAGGEMP